jgi:hypothetical protein
MQEVSRRRSFPADLGAYGRIWAHSRATHALHPPSAPYTVASSRQLHPRHRPAAPLPCCVPLRQRSWRPPGASLCDVATAASSTAVRLTAALRACAPAAVMICTWATSQQCRITTPHPARSGSGSSRDVTCTYTGAQRLRLAAAFVRAWRGESGRRVVPCAHHTFHVCVQFTGCLW